MAEVNLVVSADIQGIKTKLEDLTKSIAEIQSKMGASMKNAAETSEKAFVDASNTITKTMVENTAKVTRSLHEEEDQMKALQQLMKQSTNPDAQKSLQKEIDATSSRIKSLGGSMQKFRDITNMSLGEMRKYMRELRNISLVGMTPAQIKQVNTEIAKLTDSMADYKGMLRATGDNTQMLISAMQGFVGIAQGVTGTLALMGIENKNLEKSMLALINLSQAMSTFHQLNENGVISSYKAKIKDVAATIKLNLTNRAAAATTKAGAGAWTFLSKAMSAVPMIAVIAGMTALAGLLIKNMFSTKEYEIAQSRWNAVMSDSDPIVKEYRISLQSIQKEIDAISRQYRVLTGEISQTQADIEGVNQSYEDGRVTARQEHAKRLVQIESEIGQMISAENKRWYKLQNNAAATERQVTSMEEMTHQQNLVDIQNQGNDKRLKSNQLYNEMRIKLADKLNLETKAQNQEEINANAQKWQSEYEAAQRFFKQINDSSYGSMWQTMKQYESDALVYGDYLKRKLWSYEQYTEAMAMLTSNYQKKMENFEIVDEPEELLMPDFTPQMSEDMKIFWDNYMAEMDAIFANLDKEEFIPSLDDKMGAAFNRALNAIGLKSISKDTFLKIKEIGGMIITELSDSFKEGMDNQIKALDEYVNAREQKIGEIQSLLEAEIQLNKDGFASNIQNYQDQLEAEQKLRDKAAAEKEKVEKKQQMLNQASQLSNIFTSVTELIAANTKWGLPGILMAAAAITGMYALLANAKSQAAASIKFEKGGRGVFDGASHSQGGIKIGNNMEAQGGEAYYILNKSATNSKGRALMDTLFDAVNGGRVNFDAPMGLNDGPISVEMKEQKEIKEIWKHLKGQKSVTYGPNYRIETFGNVRRTIKNKS